MTQHRPHPGLPGTWIISPIGAEIPLAMNALCQVRKLRIWTEIKRIGRTFRVLNREV